MKRRLSVLIVLLFSLTACAVHPPESSGAASSSVERLTAAQVAAALASEDVTFAEPFNTDLTELVQALRGAVEHDIPEPEEFRVYYSVTLYLTGGPDFYSSDDESLTLCAGTSRDTVQLNYRKDGVTTTQFLSDNALYERILDTFRTEEEVDQEALAQFGHIVQARAQESVEQSKTWTGAEPFSGYEIVTLKEWDRFDLECGPCVLYRWDVAFAVEDPDRVGWAGGMYLDGDGRVRSFEQNTYLAVRTAPDGQKDYRFLFWDLYMGETEDIAREAARQTIERAFAE